MSNKFNFEALVIAHKRVLSEEYNINIDLPEDDFLAELEELGKQETQAAQEKGALSASDINPRDNFSALIANLK